LLDGRAGPPGEILGDLIVSRRFHDYAPNWDSNSDRDYAKRS
jgi:hypothetical protein